MHDLVALFVDPSLVVIGFGLSEQLFRSSLSIHLGHRKSGRRYSVGGEASRGPARPRDKVIRDEHKGEGDTRTRVQRRAGTIYRALSAMVRVRGRRPCLTGAQWGQQLEPCRRRRCELESLPTGTAR
jgi:hypothetical protein